MLLGETEMVAHLDRVDVDDETAARVRNGAMLPAGSLFPGAGPWRLHAVDGELLGVYERSERKSGDGTALVKPSVVLTVGG